MKRMLEMRDLNRHKLKPVAAKFDQDKPDGTIRAKVMLKCVRCGEDVTIFAPVEDAYLSLNQNGGCP